MSYVMAFMAGACLGFVVAAIMASGRDDTP